MKIVHITECLAGGVLTFIRNLTSALADDEHILIYSDRDNTPDHVEELFGKNVKLVYWKNAGREISAVQDTKALFELISLLKPYKDADVVQLHSSKAGFLGRVACRLLGFKNVFYLPHGLSFAREDVSAKKKRFYITLEKIGNAFCGDYIACSESEKALLEKNGIYNVHVINNGIAVNPEKPTYRRFSYPLVVGTTGRLTYQKNPAIFDEIAGAFKDDDRVRFVWIGGGEMSDAIHKRKNIEVTGWLTPEEVQEKLKEVDLYMSTALWEGLPYSVIEAMNLGKPLLLSKCIGNVDLVKNNVNGYIFESKKAAVDYIKWLLDNPKELIEKGKESYQIVVNGFSLNVMVEKYTQLYR